MQSLRKEVLQWSDKVQKKTKTEEEKMRSRKRVAIVKSELDRVHRELLRCAEIETKGSKQLHKDMKKRPTRTRGNFSLSEKSSSKGKNAVDLEMESRKQGSFWRCSCIVAMIILLVGGISIVYFASIDSLYVFLGILR